MTNSDFPEVWRLDFDAVDALVEQALRQREADRNRRTLHDGRWDMVAKEVYGWSRAKTYLAAIICGLVARATDERADPRALQSSAPYGYAAASLWKVFLAHAQGEIDLLNLKGAPFNNSPFYGKRRVSADWENVATANRPILERTLELLDEIALMDQDKAKSALRGFLYSVPDHADKGRLVAKVDSLDLKSFFVSLDLFLLDAGEGGRRAQAMVAAAMALVHADKISTPQSVNDPSRTIPGDVRVTGDDQDGRRLALFAEAKQKRISREDIGTYADEIKQYDPRGLGMYAALVNDRSSARSERVKPLPDWSQILESEGVLMTVWSGPQEMVREAIVWSGLAADVAVARFVELLASYLQHVEVDESTILEWRELASRFGVVTEAR